VIARYRSRTSEQLGSASLEPVGEGLPPCLTIPWPWPALPPPLGGRRRPAGTRGPPRRLLCLEALSAALAALETWPAVYVRFEAGLLQELGFGLDLSKCAATGSTDDLIYVSPRTGRAVSRDAGAAYADRLLKLPPFLLASQSGLGPAMSAQAWP